MAKPKSTTPRISNRRARYEYDILERYEAGLILTGSEVKSLRQGRASLSEGFATIDEDEPFLRSVHIAEYASAGYAGHNPTRKRKLLLHKREIKKLTGKLNESGLTVIPLALYFKNGYAKVLLGLARGKKAYDKRQAIKERDADRELQRQLSGKNVR
jgi:SsrA-binding protein